jgi:hypothetical protein
LPTFVRRSRTPNRMACWSGCNARIRGRRPRGRGTPRLWTHYRGAHGVARVLQFAAARTPHCAIFAPATIIMVTRRARLADRQHRLVQDLLAHQVYSGTRTDHAEIAGG